MITKIISFVNYGWVSEDAPLWRVLLNLFSLFGVFCFLLMILYGFMLL